MINFKKTIAENIVDSYFIDSQLITIIFDNSVLKSFTGNTLNGMYKGLQFIRNSNGTVSNSIITGMIQKVKFNFILFSHFLHKVQAALQFISRISLVMAQELVAYFNEFLDIIDSNVNITNMTFSNNNAYNGGAISIYCNYLIPCSNQISGWEFNNNTASNDGGAINYNSYSPKMVGFHKIMNF